MTAAETILVRAVRPFRTESGIWIQPGSVVAVSPKLASIVLGSGAGVPARTSVDEAAVIRTRELAVATQQTLAQRNGKCRTLAPSNRPRSRSAARS